MKMLLLALAMLAVSGQAPVRPFTLTSTSFRENELLKPRYVGNNPANRNCIGENVSPQLGWADLPAGTTSLAFVMFDPEGRDGAGVDHWVAYGVRPERGAFAEGAVSRPGPDHVGGKGTAGFDQYMGPCTPYGVAPHHYTFLAYATDLAPDALPPGLTRAELLDRVKGHVKGVAGLVARFLKPTP